MPMTAMPSMGTPTIPRIIIKSGTEPPGIPAVTMAVMTAITTTTSDAVVERHASLQARAGARTSSYMASTFSVGVRAWMLWTVL